MPIVLVMIMRKSYLQNVRRNKQVTKPNKKGKLAIELLIFNDKIINHIHRYLIKVDKVLSPSFVLKSENKHDYLGK